MEVNMLQEPEIGALHPPYRRRKLERAGGSCSRQRGKRDPKMLDIRVHYEKQSGRAIMTIAISDVGSDPHL